MLKRSLLLALAPKMALLKTSSSVNQQNVVQFAQIGLTRWLQPPHLIVWRTCYSNKSVHPLESFVFVFRLVTKLHHFLSAFPPLRGFPSRLQIIKSARLLLFRRLRSPCSCVVLPLLVLPARKIHCATVSQFSYEVSYVMSIAISDCHSQHR